MKSFLAPAVALMNRLNYSRKFALLGAMSLTAIILLAGGLYMELSGHIRTTRHELEGLKLIEPISRVVQFTQRHRGLSTGVLSGVVVMRDWYDKVDAKADEAYAELDARLPPELRSRANWQDIRRRWQDIHANGMRWPVAQNFDAHTSLIEEVLNFETLIADEYELTLDPQFDSYYLIDTIIDALPDALEHFGQIRAHGTGMLGLKRVNQHQKLDIYGNISKLRDALVTLKHDLEKSTRHNPALRITPTATFNEIAESVRRITNVVETDILTERFSTAPQDYFAMSTTSIDSVYDKMYTVLIPAAEDLLRQREAAAKASLYLVVGFAVLLFMLMSYLAMGIAHSVADSVRGLANSARAFVDGDLDERVQLDSRDELRQAGDSFNEMADGFNAMLKARREAEISLTRSNADLTRFAEVSAHHLMEPVRRLGVYSQRLRARLEALPQGTDEEALDALNTIGRDAARLRVLVRDIQLYLAAGEARGEIKAEDVNAVLATLRQRMAASLVAAEATLVVGQLPPAVLDRPRLADIFSVLLENALQHGRPADPSIAPRILVSGERVRNASRYFVRDNGPGIPAQYYERVFEIFERLAPGGGDAGSGIGLSIARRIVESRGGKILIQNSAEGGTQVMFELPDGDVHVE